MTPSPRPSRWRPRYWAYGPISDARPADQLKILELIQRGQAVTDERLVAQALAYARFRAGVCKVFGLIFLVLASGEAVTAVLGSVSPRIVYAVLSGGFLLTGIGWLWQADRCRRGGQATAQACAGKRE